MKKVNLSMIRGDTMIFYLTLKCNQPPDWIVFAAASNNSDDCIFRRTTYNGITLISSEDDVRKYKVVVSPENTKNAIIRDYLYNLRVAINGDVFTFLYGTLTLLPDQIQIGEE